MMFLKYIIMFFLLIFKGIYGLNETCTTNFDCNGKAVCITGVCVCDQVSHNVDGECLSYVIEYKGYCLVDEQCKWMGSNAICNHVKRICDCSKNKTEGNNYRWYQGKCKKYVGKGDKCDKDLDCFDEVDPLALKCANSCTCNDGYYDRGPDCRKISKEKGDCAINKDCNPKEDSGLICHIGKCQQSKNGISKTYLEEDKENHQKINIKTMGSINAGNVTCTRDYDCGYIANSICDSTTHTCKCKSDKYFLNNGNCLPGFAICDESKNGKDCNKLIPHSSCFKGVCVCKQGYFFFKNKCIAEIGMPDSELKSVEDCEIKPAIWKDNACYCRDYWFKDDTNRKCIKTTLQQFSSCLSNEWCNAMGPYSFCNESSSCECSNSTKLNETIFYCEGSRPEDQVCLRDGDCRFNEKCQYGQCKCIENYSDINGECLPDLGGNCELETCSSVDNSVCLDGVCQCTTNFINYNARCLAPADKLGDNCTESVQCQKLNFSECSVKKQCSCIDGYKKQSDNKCWELKAHGDPCMNTEQCTMVLSKRYECRNSKCLCPIGTILDSGICIESSSFSFRPFTILQYSLFFGFFIFRQY